MRSLVNLVADLNRDCYNHICHPPAGFPEVRKSSRTGKMYQDPSAKSCFWLSHRVEIINLNCSSSFHILKFTDYFFFIFQTLCHPTVVPIWLQLSLYQSWFSGWWFSCGNCFCTKFYRKQSQLLKKSILKCPALICQP